MSVVLNTKHLSSFINEEEYKAIYPQVEAAHNQLEAKNGPGNDFLGWMYLPRDYDKEEFARIKEAAKKIRNNSELTRPVVIIKPLNNASWESVIAALDEMQINQISRYQIGIPSPEDLGMVEATPEYQKAHANDKK